MRLTPWRRVALLVSTVVLFAGLGTGASWALWSVGDTVTGQASSGTIAITANGAASAPLTALTGSGMGPGAVSAASITVANTGSGLPLSYQITMTNAESPAASVLGDNIAYVVWPVASAAACTTAATVTGAIGTGTLGTTTNQTVGAARPLAIGASEVLCIRLTGSATMPNTVQGQSVSSVLTFTGSSV